MCARVPILSRPPRARATSRSLVPRAAGCLDRETVPRLRLASSRRARRECHGGFLRPLPAHGLRGRRQSGAVGASEAERGERGSAMLALERSLLRGFLSAAESQKWKQGEISATGEGWDEPKPRWRLSAPRAAVSGLGRSFASSAQRRGGGRALCCVSRCLGWRCGCCRSRCGHGLSASVLRDSSSRCFPRLSRAVKSLWRKRNVS